MFNGGVNALKVYIEHEQARRKWEREQLTAELRNIPASAETLDRLSLLTPADFHTVIRTHPGYATNRKLESLWSMLDTFRFAVSDLQANVRQFAEKHRAVRHRIPQRELERIVSAVRRDVLAASTSAAALVALARRIRDLVSHEEYDSERKKVFDSAQHEFVSELRNNLSHVTVINAGWKVSYKPTGADAGFEFDCAMLLEECKFNEPARSFIQGMGKNIDVAILFENYSDRVERFYNWLRGRIDEQLPVALADCRRCVRTHHVRMARTTWRMLLQTWIRWGIDPYSRLADYLADYLEPEQIQEILQLPHRSTVQVQRIIDFVDRDNICDDELRSLAFQLFKVTSSPVSHGGSAQPPSQSPSAALA